jgi:N-methylhydantoinase A
MGGTSADMPAVQELEPAQTTRTTVGNLPIIVPVVSVTAIGAGGGSVVWVDGQGLLKVGPHSAGALPGPACYAAGGTEATVTDCYVVAGFIDPTHFLGGRLALDVAAARRALETVADALGMAGEDRAERVALYALRIATAAMASEIARDLAQKGEDARDYALIAFGGAGPTQALHLAEEVGISCVIIPAAPSTFCALGAILADVKRDFVASRFLNLADGAVALDGLSRQYERLETIAAAWIAAEGDILGATRFETTADLRYAGQAFDLQVRLPEALRRRPDAAAISELFHQAHEKVYSFRDPNSSVEITAERLRVVGTIPPIELPAIVAGAQSASTEVRRIYLESGWRIASVQQRDQLAEGATILGPAIIEQEDTTTLIRPDWNATVDRIGNIIATTLLHAPTSPG